MQYVFGGLSSTNQLIPLGVLSPAEQTLFSTALPRRGNLPPGHAPPVDDWNGNGLPTVPSGGWAADLAHGTFMPNLCNGTASLRYWRQQALGLPPNDFSCNTVGAETTAHAAAVVGALNDYIRTLTSGGLNALLTPDLSMRSRAPAPGLDYFSLYTNPANRRLLWVLTHLDERAAALLVASAHISQADFAIDDAGRVTETHHDNDLSVDSGGCSVYPDCENHAQHYPTERPTCHTGADPTTVAAVTAATSGERSWTDPTHPKHHTKEFSGRFADTPAGQVTPYLPGVTFGDIAVKGDGCGIQFHATGGAFVPECTFLSFSRVQVRNDGERKE